uniref:E3 ubiquitin-protein ligase RNF213-like n=1 Tax=Ictidomys tridecemlineatus TaxID=43179 RepID=UPI001A9EBB25|nr:E3 ubiquitin-protein ligase RNF213-like [Ictidomys tridecemlineatus]
MAQSRPSPQEHMEEKDLHTSTLSGDTSLSQEVSGPPTSTCKDSAQGLPLPESKGDSEPQKEAQRARQHLEVPASGEGETKDRLAVPGEKPGENSSEPKDLRKPEGSDKNDTAVVTKEKEQKNQKASSQAFPSSWLNPEEGITMYFHTIIPTHVTLYPKLHTVFIRGGEELGQPEWSDACEMYYTE